MDLDLTALSFDEIVEVTSLQSLMDDFYVLTRVEATIRDNRGEVVVSTGYQEICKRFHPAFSPSAEHCLESDRVLSHGVQPESFNQPGSFKLYRCKNNLYGMATPLYIEDQKLGTLFLGPFLLKEDPVDRNQILSEAEQYGFDTIAYSKALDNVPCWNRKKVTAVKGVYTRLAEMISQQGYDRIRFNRNHTDGQAVPDSRHSNMDRLPCRPADGNSKGAEEEAELRSDTDNQQVPTPVVPTDLSNPEHGRNLFEIAFDASPDAININRWDGTYIYVNKGMVELSGYEKDELIGNKSTRLNVWASPEDRLRFFRQLDRHGTLASFEADFRTKKGGLINGLVSATRLTIGGEEHVLSITRDIGALKKAHQALQESEARLYQVQKLETIGTLAGGIAHDFNNLLFPVIVLSELLLEKDLPDSIKKDLDSILNAGKRARELVAQILTFSRKNHKKLEPMALHTILKEMVKLARSTLPANIRIVDNIDTGCGPAMIDMVQFQQIVMNLVSNAFHAMETTGGTLSVSLYCRKYSHPPHIKPFDKRRFDENFPDKKENDICIEIKDTGQGMDAHILERIFDPYFSTKEQEMGSGLGLAVARGLVESFNGRITAESSLNKGSVFTICLPAVEKKEDKKNRPVRDHRFKKTDKKILVVDDEDVITKLLTTVLERAGFTVTAFNDAARAFLHFETSPDEYALIISDLTMPFMTGDQLCQKISRIRPDLSKILLTGYNESRITETYDAYGIDKVLFKPLEKEEILTAIDEVIK